MTRRDHVRYRFECGAAVWQVRAVVLEERVGRPFRAELRVVAGDAREVAELVGTPATLSFSRDDEVRLFRGEVTRAEVSPRGPGCCATVRFEPQLARRGWTNRSRIFQGLSALEIVREIFHDLTICSRLVTPRPPIEYCVQYQESDLALVSRLLEREGMVWFLDDEDESSTMQIVDDNDALRRFDELADLRMAADNVEASTQPSIDVLSFTHRPASGGVLQRDWMWMSAPATVVENCFPDASTEPRHELHHAHRGAASSAPNAARHEYERRVAVDVVGSGRSNIFALGPGRPASILVRTGEQLEIVVTAVVHRGECPEVELGASGGSSAPNYVNTFECQPLGVAVRLPCVTPRPRIHGMHTAVVVGPPGEEIHTDAHGRIRVRMHWDRATNADEDASCWIRVAQGWAGQGWGTMFLPRVGMEVLIAFLDGDPDRPMCIGSVYNGAHPPPYALPRDRTKSTIRTQSTPGGDGFNELAFDDAAGAERVHVRAQRDLDASVLRNLDVDVYGDEARRVGGERHTHVEHDDVVRVGGDVRRRVDGAEQIRIGGSVAMQIDGGPGEAAVGVAGMAVSIVKGGYRLTAPERIELVCGPSAIVMTPTGITITCPSSVDVACSASIVSLSPASLGLAAPVLAVSAAGATLGLGAQATLSSAGGVKLECGEDCELSLDGGAKLTAGLVTIDAGAHLTAMATKVELDGSEEVVVRSEATVKLQDSTASLALGLEGISLDG